MKSLVVILFFIGMSMVVIGYNYSIINKNPKTITITKTLLDQQFSPMNVFKSKQASFDTEFNSLLSKKKETKLDKNILNSVGNDLQKKLKKTEEDEEEEEDDGKEDE
tara:strand:+ start:1319 stop:1639 length:321 start_codon:yes stop_codon:yes gene_type:complete